MTVNKKLDIMSLFPGTPREVQTYALRQVEANWDKADVFVLNMPVGAGKSRVAYAIAQYAYKKLGGAQILVPNNMLLNQYKEAFPKIHTTYRKDTYICQKDCNPKLKCVEHVKYMKYWCTGCPYLRDVKKTAVVPVGVYNYYSYMAYKAYRPVLIIDEAHNIIDILRSLMAQRLWQHKVKYPSYVETYAGLHKWAKAMASENAAAAEVLEILEAPGKPSYIVEKAEEPYGKAVNGHREVRACLKLLPVDTSQAPTTLWPSGRVSKIVLLSATIGKQDITQMGLANRRVCVVDTGSPIEADRRPVNYVPVANVAYWNQTTAVPQLADYLHGLMSHYDKEKGLIHVPYSLATKLMPLLSTNPRVLFHDRDNKKQIFAQFKDSEEPLVLLASGMYEGIDLPYDAARWQAIAKVPWPSLAEPAVKYMAEDRPDWYNWQTIKTLIQACGRVCRAEDDYGESYILDITFEKLFSSMDKDDIPTWWRDALRFME